MSKPIQITVGGSGDPVAGTTDYINASLKGKEFYVSKSGEGIIPYTSYQVLAAGGFRLLGGPTFQNGEVYFVTITAENSEASTNSSYTNGFNYSRVMNAMLQRIGFRQPTESKFAIVNSANQISTSGRYFDDFHALVSAKNIREIQPDPTISDANFNTHLESMKRAAIMRSLNGVLNVPEHIERTLLYDREDDQQLDLVPNTGLFVGYEIETPKDDTISVHIESAILMFNEDVVFNLYLFKDGKKSPLLVREVSAIAFEPTVVNLSDVILNYLSVNSKGSTFYIGYFQDDLGTAKAINELGEFSRQLCFCASPMSSKKKAGEYDFDRTYISETNITYGLNLEISTFRDHTNATVKNAHLFDELIGLNFAYSTLEAIVYSTNRNQTQSTIADEMTKAGLQLEMQGAIAAPDSPQVESLTKRIRREAERVRKEFYPKPKAQSVSLC